jgi:HD-GYP domain-containing protein (c-di-GMP phosphodiesterase class II)
MAFHPDHSPLPRTRSGTPADATQPARGIRGWIARRFFQPATHPASQEARRAARFDDEGVRAKKRMIDSFALALEAREPHLGLIAHAAHVATVAGYLADALDLDEGEQYLLRTAAYLHEVGMLTLPLGLAERVGPLSPQELDDVRGQALVSAEIAKAAFHPRIIALITNQYSDYSDLQQTALTGRDQLLAGIFRVADLVATVTWPRAHSPAQAWTVREHLLNEGAGTRFHPLAVRAALSLA